MNENRPMPSFRRMMIFADGENIVFRYQSMIKKGWQIREGMVHVPDVFVWSNWCSGLVGLHNVLRATFYTYAVGDDDYIMKICDTIKKTKFATHRDSALPNWLTPKVFKKQKKSASAKGVDIQICVDILSQVHSNNLDAILLISGDGDYIPLMKKLFEVGNKFIWQLFQMALIRNSLTLQTHFIVWTITFFHMVHPNKQKHPTWRFTGLQGTWSSLKGFRETTNNSTNKFSGNPCNQ